ncbi:MAG: glutamate ABC transporter substrate-binding protein [Nakamurella sp.]
MNFRKLGPALAGLVAAGLALSACGSTDAGSAVSSATSAAGNAVSSATSAAGSATSAAGSAVDGATSSGSSAAGSVTGTGAGGAGLVEKAAGGSLKIGIKFDQPGLGLQNPDGSFTGFDVDVAKYVAKELGVPESGITFVQTKSSERESSIENGTVDYIVATYSITDSRKEKVNFAGPYFVAHQDLLVADGSDITGPEAMSGKILCSVAGSTSAQKVKDTYAKDVALQEYGTYTECVQALAGGAVDAVTTDDVILAGYAAQYPGQLKLVGKGFTDEKYGIGLTKGDTAGTAAVNAAIKKMIDDGSWAAALEANVGPSGYVIPTPPTVG